MEHAAHPPGEGERAGARPLPVGPEILEGVPQPQAGLVAAGQGAGRALLASKLAVYDAVAIANLFLSSNFPDAETGQVGATNVQPWVEAFQEKVAAITNRSCAPSPGR